MKFTIVKRPRNTIYDTANPHKDREILVPSGCRYAVVLASYYGGKGYTCHRTEEAAIKKSKNLWEHGKWSHKIVKLEYGLPEMEPYEDAWGRHALRQRF